MTDKTALGSLTRVDVRDHWEHEATDFTPWLAEEDNIARLGEALGLNLSVVEVETNVGPFRADVLCQEIGSENLVLIENQLEPTDHNHLGQIITYSAGLDAVKVVWIARQFRDEHRAAIDWLNRISAEDFSFFGVEIELWKIGDSAAAPKFEIVSAPNDWARQAGAAARDSRGGGKSPRADALRVFWGGLSEYIKTIEWPLDALSVTGRNWIRINAALTGLALTTSYSTSTGEARIYILSRSEDGFYDEEAIQRYAFITGRRDEVELRVGEPIRWYDSADTDGGYGLITMTPESNVADPDQARFDWITRTILAIRSAFEEAYRDFESAV